MQLLRSVVAKNYRSLWKHQSRVFSSLPRNNDGKSTMESGTRLAMSYGIFATLGGSLSAYGWHLHADRVVLREKNESEFFKLKALLAKANREQFEKLEQMTKLQEEQIKLQEEQIKQQEEQTKLQEEQIKQQEELDKWQEKLIKWQEELEKGQEEVIKWLIVKRGDQASFYRNPAEIIKSYLSLPKDSEENREKD